ncbi:uncharacterized protein LOC122858549 [Aphidius gifuensis]|uniref:uncharacterized protein LOC122858549 n=1 Tax=Aphidius gifuensis TaxID=684658 RepID=UPI001CDC5963|nr:uncharacterized protein LOC122858549 [Aphidius gifuensis]
MIKFIFLLISSSSFFSFCYCQSIKNNGCSISIKYLKGDLNEPQPLILSNNKENINFLYPNKKTGKIELLQDEIFHVACPGNRNNIQGIFKQQIKYNNQSIKIIKQAQVKCINDRTFMFNNNIIFNFTNIKCKYLPNNIARRINDDDNNKCHHYNASYIEIGFLLDNNKFLKTHEICRDDDSFKTYYTVFNLTKNIASFNAGYPRPRNWKSSNFYGKLNMDTIYKTSNQLSTIAKQIGSYELANKYIIINESKYLAKGHMVAKADFVYGSAQLSTFWYLNAAPQWQTFNAGNWNSLENDVRKFADRKSLDLVVYTGIHGQMTLSDINDIPIPIYLHDEKISVPRFYWKIIYDPLTKRATGFVGLNDPFAKNITRDMFICRDISKRIEWLNWQQNKISKGISYACQVQDLRKAIPSIPDIHVVDILI